MFDDPKFLLQMLSFVFGMGATYSAIRSDLKRLNEKVNDAHDEAKSANESINQHVITFHTSKS